MSDTTERVAQALYTHCGDGMGNLPYDAARAAIEAMREPTEAMIVAAANCGRRMSMDISLAKLHDIFERALGRLELAECGGDKATGTDALKAIFEEVRREAVDATR